MGIKKFNTVFGANKKYDSTNLKIVILHTKRYGDEHYCIFNSFDDLDKLLKNNNYNEEEIKRLKDIFQAGFTDEHKYDSIIVSPNIPENDWDDVFKWNNNKYDFKTNYCTREDTNIKISYKNFNRDYWRKQKWL